MVETLFIKSIKISRLNFKPWKEFTQGGIYNEKYAEIVQARNSLESIANDIMKMLMDNYLSYDEISRVLRLTEMMLNNTIPGVSIDDLKPKLTIEELVRRAKERNKSIWRNHKL